VVMYGFLAAHQCGVAAGSARRSSASPTAPRASVVAGAVAMAAVVGLSRVATGAHFPHQVGLVSCVNQRESVTARATLQLPNRLEERVLTPL
jgi:hypothetical protein